MAKSKNTSAASKSSTPPSLLGDSPIPEGFDKHSLDSTMEPDFDIPQAVVTELEMNSAHINAVDLSVPVKVKQAYLSKGWELKWVRYTRPNGEFDHAQINKYLVLLGGNFVSLKQVASVDPFWAQTLSQSSYRGGQVGDKTDPVISRGDLALVMYKATLAQAKRAENSRQTLAALTAGEQKARADGLDVVKFSDT